jgi:CRP-like cAMP-binding protein
VKLICLGKEDFNMLMEDEGIAGSTLSQSHAHRQLENVQKLVQMAANIQGKMTTKTYSENEQICAEGEVSDVMYHIEHGELSVHRKEDGTVPDVPEFQSKRKVNVAIREKATQAMLRDESRIGHLIAVLKDGDVFGEHSLMTGQTRSATVVCRSKQCVVNILSKADFLQLAATGAGGVSGPSMQDPAAGSMPRRTAINEMLMKDNKKNRLQRSHTMPLPAEVTDALEVGHGGMPRISSRRHALPRHATESRENAFLSPQNAVLKRTLTEVCEDTYGGGAGEVRLIS